MNLKKKITLEWICSKTLLFGRRKPIIVSWSITDRCNLQCKYCGIWQRKFDELKTPQILDAIKDLFRNGTRIIRFTGGEPLLKEDIAIIINYACDLGIAVTISTNGILLPEKIKEIKRISGVFISLDGPEDIHNSLRGIGSYAKALEAIKIAKESNISVSIATTLNSLNLNNIKYLLGIAKKFDAKVYFQPSLNIILGGDIPNKVSPEVDRYKSAVLSLIEMKRTNKYIGNSVSGLKHLLRWPYKTDINCIAGKIIYRLDSSGNMNPCARFPLRNNKLNIMEKGINYCLEQLRPPFCGNCWCSSMVELNLIAAFNINALFNAIKM